MSDDKITFERVDPGALAVRNADATTPLSVRLKGAECLRVDAEGKVWISDRDGVSHTIDGQALYRVLSTFYG